MNSKPACSMTGLLLGREQLISRALLLLEPSVPTKHRSDAACLMRHHPLASPQAFSPSLS